MKTSLMTFGLSLAALLALSACGGSNDPLTGTWSNSSCFGSATTPADVEKCSTALTFKDSLEIELEAKWFSMPATATNPGCITTKQVTGQTWSTNADAFTVSGSGSSTIERSSCVNDTDNLASAPTSDIEIPNGDTRYQITDNTLTILAGKLKGTYTK
ncbi:MAG: hypothetical protein ABI193_02155 [Minicystis sp.]